MRSGIAALLVLLVFTAASFGQEDATDIVFAEGGRYGAENTFMVGVCDVDMDGDLDAVFSNMGGESRLWLGNGDGTFRRNYQSFGSGVHGVAFGDLDGDGDPDLVLASGGNGASGSVYLNDGTGRFRFGSHLDDDAMYPSFVEVFDLEGDGDLDVGIYYSGRESRAYVNDGFGSFEPLGARIPGIAWWGDLDGDGDADAVSEQHEIHGGGIAIWLNRGDGDLVRSSVVVAPTPYMPGDAALADLDNDGDLDYINSGVGFQQEGPVTVLLNDGDGQLTRAYGGDFVSGAGRLRLADFDGDGVVDVLVSALDQGDRIGLGDGSGGFVESGIRIGSI